MMFSDKPELLVLTRNGTTTIECTVYPPRCYNSGKNTGMVLHLYGHGGSCREYNMMRAPYKEVRHLLWERGYWLVVPELGGSHWMNDQTSESLDTIIESMIRDQNVRPNSVHILGTSMGGGSGLVYMIRHPSRVRSICAVFPMTDFAQWIKEAPSYLQSITQAHGAKLSEILRTFSPLHHAAYFIDIPVLLIHGNSDSIVPVHHSRNFADALRKQGSPITYHEVSGVGHDDAIVKPFQHEIVDFFDQQKLYTES